MLTDADKQDLKNAHAVLYRKGLNTPDEAVVGVRLTQLLERLLKVEEKPAKEDKKA